MYKSPLEQVNHQNICIGHGYSPRCVVNIIYRAPPATAGAPVRLGNHKITSLESLPAKWNPTLLRS
jgi:hypothetical protein